jgi:hypothetical protein
MISPSRAGSNASDRPVEDIGSSRSYKISKPLFHRHYDINSAEGAPLLYAVISLFTRKKRDLTLHAGTSSQAQIVAVSNFLKFSGDYKSGLGDPDNVNSVQWENMTKENIQSSKHRFEMTIPHDPSQVPAARRSFL